MTSEKPVDDSVEQLKTIRDELKLQAHLLEMELEDEWQDMEKKWDELNRYLKPVEEATEEAVSDVGAAVSLLVDEIGKGYEKIKNAL